MAREIGCAERTPFIAVGNLNTAATYICVKVAGIRVGWPPVAERERIERPRRPLECPVG